MTAPADPRTRAAVLGGGVLALVALVAGLAFSGAAAASAVLDPGALVRWGVPVVQVVADSATAVTLGALALCALVLTPPGRAPTPAHARATPDGAPAPAWRAASRVAVVAAVVWTLALLGRLVLTYARTAGVPLDDPGFGAGFAQFVTEIPLGRSLALATALTAGVAVVSVAVTSMTGAGIAAVLAAIALVPTALTGHAAGSESHELAVSALWVHVVAVSVWAGGLVVLCLVAPRLRDDLPPAATRFSRLVGWCFALVGVSGVVSGAVRLGNLADLATPYGLLLVAKAVLYLLLGLAGWAHRRATLPRVAGDAWRSGPFWRLAAGEVLLMGAVMGVAVALASTQPPTPAQAPAVHSPAHEITGYAVPPVPSPLTWLTQWRPDLLFAVAAVAAVVVYLRWVVRLRRRGDAWPWPRTLSWVLGAVVFAWVTSGGPAVYGQLLFSAHMLAHMLLAMVVPIFFVLGAPLTLAFRALPRRPDGSRGPREWLLTLVHSRVAQFFANPLVAALNFAGSMIVFYYSPLFELALSTHLGHVLMVVHFTLAGYLFANVLIGVDPGPTRPPYPMRLLLLFATMAFHAFFGVAVTQATTLFAADHFAGLGLPWRVDALADQEVGGAIAWGVGEFPTVVLAIAVALSWARHEERTARRDDRRADRDDDAELAAYNARLAELAGRDGG
ncbi:cytochrome c oxidase assembly protein [Georgenia faecalis]|uniref:Cytochrome c oxidase assembly protein n=1 Tax=Georgenia faecalis TaxID=2483799 RepID=A0ABV9D8E3_9MICO|nr:cytochrome c oxidase assembly protein [Georgenia faecalis]